MGVQNTESSFTPSTGVTHSLSGELTVQPWVPSSTCNPGLQTGDPPKCHDPTAGQQAGLCHCSQDPASPTHALGSGDQTPPGSCFPIFMSAAGGGEAREAPGALNHVWKPLRSPVWKGAAGRPKEARGWGDEWSSMCGGDARFSAAVLPAPLLTRPRPAGETPRRGDSGGCKGD